MKMFHNRKIENGNDMSWGNDCDDKLLNDNGFTAGEQLRALARIATEKFGIKAI